MGSPRLWTFGHSTRTADETVALLRRHGIGRVVDVRSIPGSRAFPHFAAAEMQRWLPESGIDYRRIESLGGRRKRQPVDPRVNAGWTHESFHRYADWTLTDEFEHGLADLAEMCGPTGVVAGGAARTAIMCAEAVPWRCHRSLIATVLTVRGWQVDHILGSGATRPHHLGEWGPTPVAGPDGHVTYPATGTPPLF